VPPIFKHSNCVAHRKQVADLNSWIKTLKDDSITICDVARLFYTRKQRIIRDYYKETYGTGKPDLIHWNEKAMDVVDKKLHAII
jgi:hypothetical protein